MKVQIVLLFCFLEFISASFAKEAMPHNDSLKFDAGPAWGRTKDDAKNILFDSWGLITSPADWDKRDWTLAGSVVLTTAAFSLMDQNIRKLSLFRDKSRNKNKLEAVGSTWGTFISVGVVTGISLGEGIVTGSNWARETGILLTSSLFMSNIVSSVGKKTIGRLRPNNGSDQYFFKPFSNDVAYHSAPSGHLSYAWTASFALAEQMESITMKAFFYGLGGLSGFARIYSNAHWPSDVLFTGFISYFIVQNEKNRIERRKRERRVAYNRERGIPDEITTKNFDWSIIPGNRSLFLVLDY